MRMRVCVPVRLAGASFARVRLSARPCAARSLASSAGRPAPERASRRASWQTRARARAPSGPQVWLAARAEAIEPSRHGLSG